MIPKNIQKLLTSSNKNDIRIGFEICRIKYPVVSLELKTFLYKKVNSFIVAEYVKRNLSENTNIDRRYVGWKEEN